MNTLSFIVYCFVVTSTPGPTNIIILSTVQNHGLKTAMQFTYGSIIGFAALLASSAILNSVLTNILPNIIIYLQIIGTIYMIYLAYKVYKIDASEPTPDGAGSFLSGIYLQFLNPKVVIFTFTVFPSFILPYYDDIVPLTISVIVITIIGFIAFILWVSFGMIFKKVLREYNKIVNIVLSVLLLYAAVMIWV